MSLRSQRLGQALSLQTAKLHAVHREHSDDRLAYEQVINKLPCLSACLQYSCTGHLAIMRHPCVLRGQSEQRMRTEREAWNGERARLELQALSVREESMRQAALGESEVQAAERATVEARLAGANIEEQVALSCAQLGSWCGLCVIHSKSRYR